jgi:hypothetical protein
VFLFVNLSIHSILCLVTTCVIMYRLYCDLFHIQCHMGDWWINGMYMYVCMYACVRACMYVFMRPCARVLVFVCVWARVLVFVCVYIHNTYIKQIWLTSVTKLSVCVSINHCMIFIVFRKKVRSFNVANTIVFKFTPSGITDHKTSDVRYNYYRILIYGMIISLCITYIFH